MATGIYRPLGRILQKHSMLSYQPLESQLMRMAKMPTCGETSPEALLRPSRR
uniref:Uncharacterized protein n=1 Tax=Brassica oleracea var. oleracea TaxID=109376 RepID=A0A0D3AH62_BRAOL